MSMLWIKALHIIAVICWFAALFYLPRLFVYHAMTEDTAGRERFKVMERKLYRGIATPSMIITLIAGFLLGTQNPGYYLGAHWFLAKMACVLCLLAYHFTCAHFLQVFAADNNVRSHTFYRFFNEVPVIFLIIIVLLVEVGPAYYR